MSFLAPFFLAGALVVGLPIIFHLIRRSTRERTVFSSLMFLQPSPPRLSRRSRLEHILLLLLRCAAVVLLALGFARPFLKHVFPEDRVAGPAKKTLVMLDTSASMRRQGLWTTALDKVGAILRQASLADQVALFTFDRQLNPLLTFEEWNASSANDRLALARNRLAGVTPGWASTHLDTALIRAAEMLAESEGPSVAGPRQVVVVTDLQEGSDVRALQGHEWPKGVQVMAERVDPRAASNAGIQLVTDSTDSEFSTEAAVRVRVSNAADSQRQQFRAGWAGPDGLYVTKPADVYVPPGQARVISLAAPATNISADRIVLTGDEEPFDNTVFVVPPDRTRAAVLYFGGDSPTDNRGPFFFLARALQETRRQQLRVIPYQASASLSADELDEATLLVVTGALGEHQSAPLRDAVTRGKTLLFAPTGPSAAPTLDAILGPARSGLEEKRPDNYAMLGQIEFRHPLFAPFADARFSDFTKIHFWRYRRIDATKIPDARILAQFDTGDPAILEIPSGKGRVILLAAGWHPADSQLALSSKFVPLLYALLEYSGAAAAAPQQYFVG
ncbi:MAG TPA: BatA domain-containing protein, partial [Verrucomicrobiae bacterium]